jgi:hypothetical protein
MSGSRSRVSIVCQAFNAGGEASDPSNLILPTLTLEDLGIELNDLSRYPDPTKLTFTLVNPDGHQVIFNWSQGRVSHSQAFLAEGACSISDLYPISTTFVVLVLTAAHQFQILGINEVQAFQVFDYQRPRIVGGL